MNLCSDVLRKERLINDTTTNCMGKVVTRELMNAISQRSSKEQQQKKPRRMNDLTFHCKNPKCHQRHFLSVARARNVTIDKTKRQENFRHLAIFHAPDTCLRVSPLPPPRCLPFCSNRTSLLASGKLELDAVQT